MGTAAFATLTVSPDIKLITTPQMHHTKKLLYSVVWVYIKSNH